MGINAVLRSESREELASVLISAMVLSHATSSAAFAESRLLRYLVPWGDTVFNQAQARDLQDDIRVIVAKNGGSPLGQHLLAVEGLVEQLSSRTHAYLWFIGD